MTPGKGDVSPISQELAESDRPDRKTRPLPSERKGLPVENRKGFAIDPVDAAIARFYEQIGAALPVAVASRPKAAPAIATIYFIGPKDGPIKIGWASRLEFRLRDLRLANAFPLEVWATVEGPPSLEREYHKRFAEHRLHGEWFERSPSIESEIERLGGGA